MKTEEQKRRHAENMRNWRRDNPDDSKKIQERFLSKDPEYFRRKAKEWRENNPEEYAVHKRKYRIRKYGLSPEQYAEMVAKQGGACSICLVTPDRDLDIDHCHITNTVRGLLCNRCNKVLGQLKDDIMLLRRMIDYINDNGAK